MSQYRESEWPLWPIADLCSEIGVAEIGVEPSFLNSRSWPLAALEPGLFGGLECPQLVKADGQPGRASEEICAAQHPAGGLRVPRRSGVFF